MKKEILFETAYIALNLTEAIENQQLSQK